MPNDPHDHDHDHHHGDHDHGGHAHHGHHHAPASFGRAFAIGIALNLGYLVVEATVGLFSGSLALVADAGHNLSDVLALALAWGAATLGRRPPSRRYTYGFGSTTIFAALANAALLLVVTGGIAWDAILRLAHPQPVNGTTVIWVAAIGIVVNAATAVLFAAGRKGDINIRGAFLHMLADALVSLGVVVAGAVILWTGWTWLDPAAGLAVGAVIIAGTWSLLAESVNLAVAAVPDHIDSAAVEAFLAEQPGVDAVHDLHIWAMSTTETALTAHLVRPQGGDDALLVKITEGLRARFGIGHATLQIERGDQLACPLAPADVV